MRNRTQAPFLACLAVLALAPAGCDQGAGPAAGSSSTPVAQMTDDDKAVYTLGLQVGLSLRNYDLSDAELETMLRGLRDTRAGKREGSVRELIPNLQRFQRERHQQTVQNEKAEAAKFLERSAAESGAERTASGLIFNPIQEGTGPSPDANSRVKVQYHGTLRDGTVFDSSIERGEPATFSLVGVIPCWTEGVQKMKVGGKAKLVCPSEIAYGERGSPPYILPGAALAFDVELIEIVQPPAPTPATAPAPAPTTAPTTAPAPGAPAPAAKR